MTPNANDHIQRFKITDKVSTHPPYELFSQYTRAFVYGIQPRAVQGMLDFDFICGRKTASVAGIIYPFGGQFVSKMYWGTKETLLPVYKDVGEAMKKHSDVDVVVNFASSRSAYSSTLEILEYKQIRTIAIIAEGVPERKTREILVKATTRGVTIIGPASVGGIKPGCFKIGNTGGMMDNIVASKLYRPGSVGYVSKSGGMSNELNNIIAQNTDGVYEGIAIGGDRYPGSTFIDHLLRYEADPECKILVLLGEVGGVEEYRVIDLVKSGKIKKPMIAWAIGTCADMFTTEVQFGHAGSFANSKLETAKSKNEAMKKAGIHVPSTFEQLPQVLKEVYDKMVSEGTLVPKADKEPPKIPMDFSWAQELGLIRKPAAFISTISDDRGQELLYAGMPISDVFKEDIGIGGVISLLWFRRRLPNYASKFLEMVLMLTADHGPAVSGAMNTIITTRAGKDLISALVSGLLTIGTRFGGALDDAATQFSSAYDKGLSPRDFVDSMRKQNILISGIGHRIKSLNNPDQRVELIKDYVKLHFPSTKLLDYALAVEKVTTSKKDNLILNVDGCIAVCTVDLFRNCGAFTSEEAEEYLKMGVLNGMFVLGRSIGFIGHHLDQIRLRTGLYRHPWDDISYGLGQLAESAGGAQENRVEEPKKIVAESSSTLVDKSTQHGSHNSTDINSPSESASSHSLKVNKTSPVERLTGKSNESQLEALKLSPVSTRKTTFETLSPELHIHIFSFLPAPSLLNIALVSHQFHDIATSERSWKSAFIRLFGQQRFSNISSTWKQEYLLRSKLSRKWKKGQGRLSYDARVGLIRDFSIDFQTNRVIAVSNHGTISFSSVSGKVKKQKIHLLENPVPDISILKSNKRAIIGATENGQVSVFLTGKNGRVWTRQMASLITQITCGEEIVFIGTVDGLLSCFELRSGEEVNTVQFDARIEYIFVSERQKSVVVICTNEIFYADTIDNTLTFDKSPHRHNATDFLVDFPTCYVFAIQGASMTRAHLSDNSEAKYMGHMNDIVVAKLDTNDGISNGPGNGARLLATAESDGTVYVWDARASSQECEPIIKIHTGISPITHLELSPLILLVGSASGFLGVFCPLSGDHIRTIHSKRFASCSSLSIDTSSLTRGGAAFGKILTCFDFSKLSRNLKPRSSRKSSVITRDDIQQDIDDQIDMLEEEGEDERKRQWNLERWNGNAVNGLNNREALDLGLLMSKEEEIKMASIASENGLQEVDEELAYILALSKAESESQKC
ncbi:putative ATP-citrate synthase subunit 1 [Neolecta irregularis DAH-3]|uniref:ATP citrate synthase n=1 Tax=Neolecta irregularis (strain DAH-3) TaxID=1198029 RepID=A0A1U7LLD0_NEOID|nr:putative ATP-citrate synthase subunit 1 [Neolecta irregularis DAH-3]|eukprot:OLL23321.1 putative ATP-citrate synthase subunit 1 [Neolecta irregularis DAH-3]